MKPAHLLRWYPRAWRERYGEELLALIQDSLQEGRPAWRLQLSAIWGGLAERGRQARRAATAAVLRPSGSGKSGTIVMAGLVWGFVPGGLTSPPSARGWQAVALDAALAVVALTGALVLAAGLPAFPALVRFLRAGGWTTIRLRVGWAAGATAVAGIGLGLFLSSSWRGQLTFSWAGLAVYVVTGLATAGAIGLWSAAATATARYLTLAPQVRAAQYMIGALLPTAVRAMVATFVLWWAATQPSITVLVLGLVNAAIVIVLAPGRIGRAVRGGRRLRLATSGAVIINPSAHRTRGRHRA